MANMEASICFQWQSSLVDRLIRHCWCASHVSLDLVGGALTPCLRETFHSCALHQMTFDGGYLIAERSEANNRAVCDLGWRMYIYIYIYIYIFASVAPGPGGAPVNSAR